MIKEPLTPQRGWGLSASVAGTARAALFLCLLLLAACSVTGVAAYEIDWSAMDSGGGTSRGRSYMMTSSIGQPTVGTIRSRTWSITGGLWSILGVVDTPGAPSLRIDRRVDTVIVSWPAEHKAFALDATPVLGATATWKPVLEPHQSAGDRVYVEISRPTGNLFFRLRLEEKGLLGE